MLLKERSARQGESDRQRRLLKAIRQQQRVSGKTCNEKNLSDRRRGRAMLRLKRF
jgi:hypothetical protein